MVTKHESVPSNLLVFNVRVHGSIHLLGQMVPVNPKDQKWTDVALSMLLKCKCVCSVCTSSSLKVIMVKARNTQSVGPVMVMILSGQEPSEMLILAPLCWVGQRWRNGGRGVD